MNIWKERLKLDKERMDFMNKVMEEYDKEYYAKLKVLQDQCEHNFIFSHLGPLNNAWFYCSKCRKSKVE